MIVRLFDVQNGKVIPTEHCYTLDSLKAIMDNYPDTYMSVYQYIFYMTCPNPDMNPFFNVPESEKEDLIIEEVQLDESPEDEVIIRAITICNKLYETPAYRAYKGIKSMLDRLAKYMETTSIEHGRDGNINSLVNVAAKFEQIRQSYKGAFNDMKQEQESHVRGGQGLAYDQM
jgi:flagellin-specific chaperone FliS